jgi:glycosyltransferase involved in cell wall biosynthesis
MSATLRILYAAAIRLPTEKAHGAQIVRTCEALARGGATVELAVPGRATPISGDAFSYYGAERLFSITPLKVADLLGWGRAGFLISALLFARRVARHAQAAKPSVIYSRDKTVLIALRFLSTVPLVWEVHGREPGWAVRFLKRAKIIAITGGIQDELRRQGVPASRIIVAHDGIDLRSFAQALPKVEARRRLNLPLDKKIALYIGRLDGWKGTDTLLEASKLLSDVQVVLIGGEPKQVEALVAAYPGVMFLGFLPYRDIAANEAAADVLVLPNTARDVTSLRYTSPLKLFSYMASGVPMVVTDLPSLREVVSEQEAFFAPADDPQALAAAIEGALAAPDAPLRARRAKEKAAEYTWDRRAERIQAFII